MRHRYLLKMLDMLTSAYNRRDLQNIQKGRELETNVGRLFALIADGYEIIQESAELVQLWDDLESAEGAVLDRYGANFGVARGAASDALYRIFIRVKMMAQLSGGDDDTIIRAAAELLGVEYSDILLEDVFPAKKALYVDQSILSPERIELIEQIARAIKRILAAGVGLRLYLRTHRIFRHELPISYGGAVQGVLVAAPVSQDRMAIMEVPVSYGGFIRPDMDSPPVGSNRTATADISGVGGVYQHTHITAKRIE